MSEEESQFGPTSYYWDGKMDGLSGYDPEPDNMDDEEYMIGFQVGSDLRIRKAQTSD